MSENGGSYINYILSKLDKMKKELDREANRFSHDHIYFESIREKIQPRIGKDAGIHMIESSSKEENPDFQNKAMKLMYGDDAMPNEKDVKYFDAGQIEADGRWGINNPSGEIIIKP